MASRQEQKDARRRAREEQEAAERAARARHKRLQYVLGGVLAVGIVAGIVVALMAGGSGGDVPKTAAATGVKLPAQQISDLQPAVEAAGCTVRTMPDEGRGHAAKTFTEADYKSNPPTSGTHYPVAAQDGVYSPANSPALGESVHALEHGRIDVQYKPGATAALRKQLEAFVNENGGYHMLLFQNTTKMPPQVAATAWDQMLSCPQPNAKMWDALRAFRDRYLDKAPEKIP